MHQSFYGVSWPPLKCLLDVFGFILVFWNPALPRRPTSEPPASEWPRRDARSVNNARGSSSSVGNLVLECSYHLFLAYMISPQGIAYPVEDLNDLLLGPYFEHFSHFFAFFSLFWRILNHVGCFHAFFIVLDRFLEVLGGFWKGFWEDFRRFLVIFSKIAIL